MSIESDLNRIAIALEVIAAAAEKIANPLRHLEGKIVTPVTRMKDVDLPAQQAAEIPATIQAAAESSAALPAKTDREILMEQCDAAKLPYPAKASVKRLKEILAMKQGVLPIAEPAANEVIPATTEAKTYTKAEAKDVLMRFAAKYGMDKAMKIITGFNVKDLSGVEAAGKLNELVEVTLKAEADHGKK